MRKIYAIGETVLDIIFSDDKVIECKPGGSMLNSAVSLGRAKQTVSLITEFSDDQVGRFISSFLVKNGVDLQCVRQYDGGKTPLALAFLDSDKNASYLFYKEYPENRFDVKLPGFTSDDIVLFGSFFGIDPSIRQKILQLIRKAKEEGAIIVYDPNFRKPHQHQRNQLLPLIKENIGMADIVRGSDEDFLTLFGTDSIDLVRNVVGYGPKLLIISNSKKAVFFDTKALSSSVGVREIDPVSTIGAGDNFNAGLIYGLIREHVYPEMLETLSESQWKTIMDYAIDFATDVCLGYDNYVSEIFIHLLENKR